MANIHIDKTGVRAPWAWAGAMLAVALGCGWVAMLPDAGTPIDPSARTARRAPPRADACCAAPLAVAQRPPVAAGDASEGASMYRTALRYSDCLALADAATTAAAEPADERYQIDPSGAFAARLAREDQARRAPCRGVGPHEFRQIDGLMREAAQRGDRDAAFFLLDREVQLAAAAAMGEGLPPDAPRRVSPLVARVESLAGTGHAPAMRLAAQLRVSGWSVAPDPVHAAAWALAAWRLESGHPPSDDELGNSGLLSGLDDEDAVQARHRAETLLAACCGLH